MNAKQSYDALIVELREIGLLASVSSLLGWDERTQLPAKGAEHRGNQSALLARMIHERYTAPKIGDWLSAVENSDLIGHADSDVATNVRETRRGYDRKRKLPASLVEEQAKLEVLAQHAWAEARRKSDFAAFAPWLEKTLVLKKQEANCLGYREHIYDALLEDYEPGCTTAQLRRVFEELRGPLVELIRRIGESGRRAPAEILERDYPAAAQEKLARDAAAIVGFDFQAGRLDVAVHPFCTDIGPGDVRLTTRYDPKYFGDAFFGVMHETGHGLYEQGLPAEHFGLPCGRAVSLGIHESQSRLWENFVGRSRAFWRFFWPKVQSEFAPATAGVGEDDWYRAINDVRPSFIRTESDETTYNLHILLRFELEQAMLKGDVGVSDLPEAWNGKMKEYLGVTPPDAARGVLQDVHWSGGGIAYFPTYTLGNLYAAQFFAQARKDLGDVDAQFARGEFAPLLGWLRKNIHAHGRRYSAGDLVRRVTGESLSAKPLLEHLNRKAGEIYGV
jgi:carboxypeptidase Taq